MMNRLSANALVKSVITMMAAAVVVTLAMNAWQSSGPRNGQRRDF